MTDRKRILVTGRLPDEVMEQLDLACDMEANQEDRQTVWQGSFKATLRERFLTTRNGRAATCLSPQGEYVASQCRESADR